MNNLYVLKDGKIINYHEDGKNYICVCHEDEIDKVIPFIKQSLNINKKF